MVSCNGKINSYGINGFLDIYNLLTYKFYNHNKSVINKDYIAFLKKHDKLDKKLEIIMKKSNITNNQATRYTEDYAEDYTKGYKIMITKLEKLLSDRIILLNDLNKKMKLFDLMNISYKHVNEMIHYITNTVKPKQKLYMQNIVSQLLEGTLTVYDKEYYSLYKYMDEFFNITKEQTKQFTEDKSFKKIFAVKNDKIFKKFIKEIDNELENNISIQNEITKMNEIYYISPYTNTIDKNKLNIEIDTLTNYKDLITNINFSFIQKKVYSIILPLIIYNDDNEPIEIRTVYSPKTWKIKNNFNKIYAEVFTYIKINYLFNIQNEKTLENLKKKFSKNIITCVDIDKLITFEECSNKLEAKVLEKNTIKTKMFSIYRLFSEIYSTNMELFDEDNIFTKLFLYTKQTRQTKNMNFNQEHTESYNNKLYQTLLKNNIDDIYDIILSDLDRTAFLTLLKNKSNISDEIITLNKLNNYSHKNKIKNKILKKVIKDKQNVIFDYLDSINNIIDDEQLEFQKRRKIVIKFGTRFDNEIKEYNEYLNQALLLNKDKKDLQNSTNILKRILKINNIDNELNQLFNELLTRGVKLKNVLQKDLSFIKKTNNFIERLINDIINIKSNINKNVNDFAKVIEYILIKKPINLEFTRETLELIHNEDIELDYFDHEIFYILLSYLHETKDDNIVDKVYNLFTNLKKMQPEVNTLFNCFEDINHVINSNQNTFNYKPYIWMWQKPIQNTWIRNNDKKMINPRKEFFLNYPFVLNKNSHFTKKDDLYPCILKWLSEDDMIFIEMAKNFKLSNDPESLKTLLNTVDSRKVKKFITIKNKLNKLANILEKNGENVIYKINYKKQTKKCILPNRIHIEEEQLNTKQWGVILGLDNDINYYIIQIKIQLLIQCQFLDLLFDIKKDKTNNRNKNRIQKTSFQLFIKKIIQYISFLYEIHTEKYMTKQKQEYEEQMKHDIHKEVANEESNNNVKEDKNFITLLDDIF
jgi:hypothetical protein